MTNGQKLKKEGLKRIINGIYKDIYMDEYEKKWGYKPKDKNVNINISNKEYEEVLKLFREIAQKNIDEKSECENQNVIKKEKTGTEKDKNATKPRKNLSPQLKEKLERKYWLIQEMARLAGGTTGLEELQKQKKSDRPIYQEKVNELHQYLEEYMDLKKYAGTIKKKYKSLTDEEKEFCRLLEMENENEEIWRKLLEES